MAQSTGAVEDPDCISALGYDSLSECSGYDPKKANVEALAMLELCGMRSTSLLPSLPGPLRSGVVAPDRIK